MTIPITYKAFIDGAWHFARITPLTVRDGVALYIYKKDWKNMEIPISSKEYKGVYAAEHAIKKHYPTANWERMIK